MEHIPHSHNGEDLFFRFFAKSVEILEAVTTPAFRKFIEYLTLAVSLVLLAILVHLHTAFVGQPGCLTMEDWNLTKYHIITVEVHGWAQEILYELAKEEKNRRKHSDDNNNNNDRPEVIVIGDNDQEVCPLIIESAADILGDRWCPATSTPLTTTTISIDSSSSSSKSSNNENSASNVPTESVVKNLADSETPLMDAFLSFLFAETTKDYYDLAMYFRKAKEENKRADSSEENDNASEENGEDEEFDEDDIFRLLLGGESYDTDGSLEHWILIGMDAFFDWFILQSPKYEVSLTKGYLYLPKSTLNMHNITTKRIILHANDSCFGNEFTRLLLDNFVGYDTPVLNSIFHASRGQAVVHNVPLSEIHDLRRANEWIGYVKEFDIIDLLFAKLHVIVMSVFIYGITCITIFLSFRETQLRTLGFAYQLHHHFRNIPVVRALLFSYLSATITYILVLIGIMFFIAHLLLNNTLPFLIISFYWYAQHYTVLCARTRATLYYWPIFFFVYQFTFFVYYFSVPISFWLLAFAVNCGLTQHAMLLFLNRYDLPAFHAREITPHRPRQVPMNFFRIRRRTENRGANNREILVNREGTHALVPVTVRTIQQPGGRSVTGTPINGTGNVSISIRGRGRHHPGQVYHTLSRVNQQQQRTSSSSATAPAGRNSTFPTTMNTLTATNVQDVTATDSTGNSNHAIPSSSSTSAANETSTPLTDPTSRRNITA